MPEPLRAPASSGFDPSDEVNLNNLGSALWRGRWLIALVTAVVLGIGGIAAWLQPPIYESSAMLRIVPEDKGFDLGASSNSSMRLLLGLENSGDLQTAVGILESRRIAEEIMDSLALHVVVRSPNVPRDRLLSVLEAPRLTRKATLELSRNDDGSYTAAASPALGATAQRVPIGEEVRLGELVIRVHPQPLGDAPSRLRLEVRPYQKTLRRLQDRLAVSQVGSGSQLLRLRYRHPDSLLVAAVPNLAAERFIEYRTRTSTVESRSILGFLREQSQVYQGDLRSAEGRLQSFLEDARVIEPKTEAEEQAKRLAEMQAERDLLSLERESLAALLRQIENSSRTLGEPSPFRQLIAFPSFLTNAMVQNILESIIALENERSELLVRRMETNTDVVGKTRRIQELESDLHRIARDVLADQERRLAALNTTFARFAAEIEVLPAREVELRRLGRQARLLEEVYQMLELKLKEEEIRAAAQLTNVHIVDTAVIPDEPEYPKPWLYLTLSGILGLFLGAGSAVLRSRANPTVNSHEDVYSATAGLPVLAAIDLSRHVRDDKLRQPDRHVGAEAGNGQGKPVRIWAVWPSKRPAAAAASRIAPLISLVDPADRLADSYRALRTNMGAANAAAGSGRVLVLAGADSGDDSAITAANLAIADAQQGTRVVLVDADLRTGSLHTLFDVAKEPGLADALLLPGRLDEVVREVAVGGAGSPLHLLTSGAPKQNPADVVGSEAMQRLVALLKERYEQVIVAAPAVNTAPDAALLSRNADSALLVVTAGSTTRPSLETAARQLQHLRVPVEGVVMNGFA